MEETVLAYIAGIIDGEGHIAISKRPPSKHAREANPSYVGYVKVGSIDPRLIYWLQKVTSMGTVYLEKRSGANSRRFFWTWHVSSKDTFTLLEKVHKYLVIKKEQAELVFRLRDTVTFKRDGKALRVGRQGLLPEIIAERDACWQALAKIHKREYAPVEYADFP